MTAHDSSADSKSDFRAAEEIRAILIGRDKAEQERIMRWVSESLGLSGLLGPTLEHSHTSPQLGRGSAERNTSAPKDIRTFVQEKQPKSDVQFVAVTAYFFRFVAPANQRKEAIGTEDLQRIVSTKGRFPASGSLDRS